jgi:hypothetical protein
MVNKTVMWEKITYGQRETIWDNNNKWIIQSTKSVKKKREKERNLSPLIIQTTRMAFLIVAIGYRRLCL